MIHSLILATLLTVAFPAENQRLQSATNTYVIGAVEAGYTGVVTVAAVTAEVHRSGAFIAMTPVVEGTNQITITAGDAQLLRTFRVAAPPPPPDPSAPPPKPRDPYADLGIPTNAVFAAKPPADRPYDEITVMLDAGHGGSDSGALSPHGWKEKDANLALVLELDAAFRKAGFKTLLTRADDTFPALYDRPRSAYANKVDAFISVHHNATHPQRDPRLARHTIAYASTTNGLALATALQHYVGAALAPIKNNGAEMKSLAVCRNPAVPSCLLEIDFINLPDGEAESWDPERRRRVAAAVVLGFRDWLAEH